MGLLDIASIRSIERGFSYYQSKCVINLKSYSETQSDGRRVICKHLIALLFTASPEEANKHIIMLNEVEEDYHLRRNMWIDSLKEMVNDMSKEELRDAYLNMLIEHGEMAELFGLDEEEDLFEDEDEFY
ncbi:TPA: SWIM zinc finger family protein [Staphylococcus aureus]|nr:SWIM zinc finger family protein [Staphylococcus aureus]